MNEKLRKVGSAVAGVAAAANAIAGVLEWGEDGRLAKVKIAGLAVFDRRRLEARRAARAARKRGP